MNSEFIVILWSVPYRDAAVVKGPFANEKAAFALASRYVLEDHKFDKATIHQVGEPLVEIDIEEEKEEDVAVPVEEEPDDALEDANVDANEA